MGVRVFFPVLAALTFAALLPAQLEPANFDIRFEPDAKLQTGTPVPYHITVQDALGKPVVQAIVTLMIEHPDHTDSVTYKAPMLNSGMYVAKPVFPSSGQWNVTVDVQRANRESARTNTYTVPD